MKKVGLIAGALASIIGGLGIWWVIRNSRLCGETARYKKLLEDGKFEVREYESLPLAGVEGAEDNQSFSRLFRYISGDNRENREIPMTTPVLIADEKGRRTMSFVLPKAVARTGAPPANSHDVEHATLPAGKFAVYRYSGFNNLLAESGNAAVLRGWMRDRQLKPEGEALVALYDPPWIPARLRRNEVLIRIDEA